MSDPMAKTQRFEDLRWLAPVETSAFLPRDQEDGALCYVQDESAMYEVRAGAWVKTDFKKLSDR
jgi:hypothetical protein